MCKIDGADNAVALDIRIASASGTCVDNKTMRRLAATKAIAYSSVLVREARNSVWPGNCSHPEKARACFIGAVAMASMLPAAHTRRSFDIAGGCLASRARFNSRFDKSPDVVEVKNDGFSEMSGEPFSAPHNVVAALQVERARCVRQQLCVADNHRHT